MPASGSWTVVVPPRVEKALRAVVPARDQRRLLEAIDELRGGISGDVKKLQGARSTYRRRVGDWRIVFEVDFSARMIHLLRVAQRGSAYGG